MRLSDLTLTEDRDVREELERLLARVNDTRVDYDRDATVLDLIAARVRAIPDDVAVWFEGTPHTYRELWSRSNQVARFLRAEAAEHAAAEQAIVGTLIDDTFDLLVAILGILKAGCVWLPANPELPPERTRFMFADAPVALLIAEKKYIRDANRLQWECPALHALLCIDSHDVHAEPESLSELMRLDLWNYVGESATDEITAGGWGNSYTGRPLGAEVMEEYAVNVQRKLVPLLDASSRVLEIGCSSGITMFRLAPHCGFYYGIDLSPAILARTAEEVARRGLANVRLECRAADAIDGIEDQFDLVVLNSVVQNWNGHNYLRDVLRKAAALLRDGGRIFIGDVMDLGRKEALLESLDAFRREHAGSGFTTKTDWSHELFLAREFFEDLRHDVPEIARVEHSEKLRLTAPNELTGFRYDTILTVDRAAPPAYAPRTKQQRDVRDLARHSGAGLEDGPCGGDLAYILYTSGTTGRPKGVAVGHRSLHNYIRWAARKYFADGGGAMPFFTSPAFDLTLTSIFVPLAAGRSVSAFRNDDVDKLLAAIFTSPHVDAVKLTPAHISILGQLDLPPARVATIVAGGEDLLPEQVRILRSLNPAIRIWNEYGPTEATVGCTIALAGDGPVNIGVPIDNTEVFVVDAGGVPAPVGVAGELCVAGDCLALGYWHDPELTARKFVEHPFRAGARMYRTGDLARWLPEGELLLLGRIDQQVKIRGTRIELGEIESALRALPGVEDAVVVDKTDATGGKCLCAYLVAPQPLAPDSLRAALGQLFPSFMIPSYFVVLGELPLTSNGKLDRRSLPEPAEIAASRGVAWAAPENELQRELAGIWRGVLAIERVGIDDNFFEIGGHSLKATQVVSRVHRRLGIEVALRELFRHPTVRALSGVLEARQRSGGFEPIPHIPDAELYDVSHAQARLWLLQKIERHAYDVDEALLIEGPLDVAKLERALRAAIARYEILRTAFVEVDGVPRQRVLEDVPLSIDERPSDAPFDLARPPLLRVAVERLADERFGDERFAVTVKMHHIITDGWSSAVFTRALLRAYAGEALPAPRIQYRDYAAWQNAQLSRAGEHRQYWLRQLAGPLPALELPLDRPRPLVRGAAGATVDVSLPAGALQRLATAHGASLFMVLLALLYAVLHRYSRQEDLIVGSPVAGRTHPDLEEQLGFFANTVALRTRVTSDLTFAELLDRVKTTALEAFEHQLYPFDRLVGELSLPRDTSRTPVFSVLLVLQNVEEVALAVEGLRISPRPRNATIAKFDLSLMLGSDLRGAIEYSTELFIADRIERMAAHLRAAADAAIGDPGIAIGAIDLLTHDEREELASFASGESRDAVEEVVDAFHRTAAADAIALIAGDRTIAYGELRARVRERAAHIEPGTVVVCEAPRGEEPVIALLAALEAGAAYLYVDPALPVARRALMTTPHPPSAPSPLTRGEGYPLTDLARSSPAEVDPARVFPAEVDLARVSPASSLLPTAASSRWGEGARRADEGRSRAVRAAGAAPAYLVYTSGSTGVPKGVVATRRCVNNLVAWQRRTIGDGLRSAHYAALGFDVAIQEILFAMASGGTLVIPSDGQRLDPRRLIAFVERHEVELLTMPFSALAMLFAGSVGPERMPSLRHLITSGEALRVTAPLRRFLEARPELALHNQYGPSETHVVTSHTLTAANLENDPPIGRPIDNTRCHVVDARLQPVPVGVAGELLIGGDNVAAGYLGDPVLTAEKFVTFRGERVYRSGDLCRWRADGTLEFLGRIDAQLKIRGYRVEPAEVEQALLSIDGIDAACVVPSADRAQLFAAFTASRDLDAATLRTALARTLPEPMIPSRFVRVDDLPRTSTGKIDRAAVAKLTPSPPPDGEAAATATTASEERLVVLWQELLQRDDFGIDDDFFALGGHSLLAARVAARLDVALLTLFRRPTIRALAQHLDELHGHRDREPYALLNAEHPRRLFAMPPILGYGIAFRGLAQQLDAVSLYAFDFVESERLLDDYADAVERLQPAGSIALLGYSAGGSLAFELARQLAARGRDVADLVFFDTFRPEAMPRPMPSDAQVADTIAQNLAYFDWFIRSDPETRPFAENDDLRELLVRKMGAFVRWYEGIANDGTVGANIHLITSAEFAADERHERWRDATLGRFTIRRGFGRHTDMLFERNVAGNAALLRDVLEQEVRA